MGRKITPIGEIVKRVFTKLEKEQAFSESIESEWKSLVGAVGYVHSRPTALRKKILTVKVDSSGWLEELTMQKRKLLKGLKRTFGKDKISEIHFKIGEFNG